MKIVLLYLLLLLGNSFLAYGQKEVISALTHLDKMLENQDYYINIKESRIDSLKNQLDFSNLSLKQQYILNREICQEYKSYISDSSLLYAMKSYEIAEMLQDQAWKDEANMHTISALVIRGMYKEAIEVQEKINRNTLPDSLLVLWYQCQQQLNHTLALYTYNSPYTQEYTKLEYLYGDSLQSVYTPSSIEAEYNNAKILIINKKYAKAEKIIQSLLEKLPEMSRQRGPMLFRLADVYYKQKEMDKFQEYMALSAMADIQTVTKENAALYSLAIYLYKEKDIKRAYKYIMYSLEDAVLCNAKLRTTRISHILPVISDAYKLQEVQHKRLIFSFMLATSILSLFLIIAIFMTYKQMKKYSVAKEKLNRANLIKEEYIRHFLYLCSAYIGKLHNFRRTVNRKITAGQIDELLKMTKSPDMVESEQKEFYSNFDLAFLHLYPNFVEEFNKLLQPEERFQLKQDELLNNEMRIFALIRLGIDDSSKIASFLHYSVNTIYTYRNKVKNKAINRDKFEEQILSIC